MQAYQALMDGRTLFLIARSGPTVFNVRDENNQTYKVILGNPNTCQCSPAGTICVHILYCLIKVLKVTKEHPLCYQTSLMDSELNMILMGQCCTKLPRREIQPFLRRSSAAAPDNGKQAEADEPNQDGFVRRRDLSEEGDDITCPICYDDMKENQALTWCRTGCGKNLHAKCMSVYAQQTANVLCPLCRSPWKLDLLAKDMKAQRPSKFAPVATVSCTLCVGLQRRGFFRCIECSQKNFYIGHKPSANGLAALRPVDYCQDCFRTHLHEIHRDHHFLMSDAAIDNAYDVTWATVKNPLSQVLDNQQLQALQNREFSDGDYDLLRSFDRKDAGDFTTVLISAMPLITTEQINSNPLKHGTKCFCGVGTEDSSAAGEQRFFIALPCHHIAHKNCLKQHVQMIIDGDDISRVCNYRCSHEGCGQIVFGGLRRKQTRPKKNSHESEQSERKMSDIHSSSSLGALTSSLRSQSAHAALGTSGVMGVSGRALASEQHQSSNSNSQAKSQSRRPPRRQRTQPQPNDSMGIGIGLVVEPINRPVPSIPNQHRLYGANDNDDTTTERFQASDDHGYRYRLTQPSSLPSRGSPAVNVGNLLAQSVQQEFQPSSSSSIAIGGVGHAGGSPYDLPNRIGGANSSKILMKRNPASIGQLRTRATANSIIQNYADINEGSRPVGDPNDLSLNGGLTSFSYRQQSGANQYIGPVPTPRGNDRVSGQEESQARGAGLQLPKTKLRSDAESSTGMLASSRSVRSQNSIGSNAETPPELANLVLEVGLGGTTFTNNGKTTRGSVARVGRRSQAVAHKNNRGSSIERLQLDSGMRNISENDLDEMLQVNHYES
jgi:hypothetical protein